MRASKKMRGDELLVLNLAPTSLRLELDKVPLWRGDHVSVRQLVEDFGRYHYLPRLRNPAVLLDAIQAGVNLATWELDSFAYAESFDEAAGRYRGLRSAQIITASEHDAALLVKPEIAQRQFAEEAKPVVPIGQPTNGSSTATRPSDDNGNNPTGLGPKPPTVPKEHRPSRFHGSVTLDTSRTGRDAGRIAEEIISHLAGLIGADVRVTLEIEANIPGGVPDNVVRTVKENSRTLKFNHADFEND